ncbi:ATP-dependent DNA helicase Pif1p [[Candida] anglica]|uniref:ATP-dependent DNA helicase PIF1 n=1 Tax=[Candida] anglica TaxID=148631 RepID=A0ABP0EFL8_9ASCO
MIRTVVRAAAYTGPRRVLMNGPRGMMANSAAVETVESSGSQTWALADTSYCSETSHGSEDVQVVLPTEVAATIMSSPVRQPELTASLLDCIDKVEWESSFEDTQDDRLMGSILDEIQVKEGDLEHENELLSFAKENKNNNSGTDLSETKDCKSPAIETIVTKVPSTASPVRVSNPASPVRLSHPVSSTRLSNPAQLSAENVSSSPTIHHTNPLVTSPISIINSRKAPPKVLLSSTSTILTQPPRQHPQELPHNEANDNLNPTNSTSDHFTNLYPPSKIPRRNDSFTSMGSRVNKEPPRYATIHLSTQRALHVTSGSNATSADPNATNPSTAVAPKAVKPMILSAEQEHILQLATHGTSLFFTGSAGTGKSVLLRSIIKSLKRKYNEGEVAVTASTGLAACNIGGITLHSFAGIGLGNAQTKKCLKMIRRNKKAVNRWNTVKVLIIDEVSMIDGNFLDKLGEIAQTLRKNNSPFGGIQLIVSGDFYQLPPVMKRQVTNSTEAAHYDSLPDPETIFAFESETWKETIRKTLILQEVFRQKGDQGFIDMLNEMRGGKVSKKTQNQFQYLSRELPKHDGIEPAELFPTRIEVDRANNKRLYELPGKSQAFQCIDSGSLNPAQRATLLNNSLAPRTLFLKKNAQVMCIKNFDETLVNGSLGQVVDFMDRETYMVYKEIKEEPWQDADEVEKKLGEFRRKAERTPPIELPEEEDSTTKFTTEQLMDSQDSIFAFLKDVEEPSQDTQSESFIHQMSINRKRDLLKTLYTNTSHRKYPLVRFLLPDGFNTREVLVEPEEWTIEDEQDIVLARRVQLPLILAWSLSIHKSQGQTLPKVKVDLRRVFERGQAYVALSRAVSRRGLQVLNFHPDKVMVHEKVNKFYTTLISASGESKNNEKVQQPEFRQKKMDDFLGNRI